MLPGNGRITGLRRRTRPRPGAARREEIRVIRIDREKCVGCGGCVDLCPRTAICFVKDRAFVDVQLCLECRTCVNVCPVKAPSEV